MSGPRSDFVAGVRAILPALPPNVPFGVIVGVGCLRLGMTPVETVVASGVLFAGAAQLAAMELVGDGAPLVVAVVTALLVNLRYSMYSAAIAPYFRDLPTRWKAFVSWLLIDVTFAIAIGKYRDDSAVSRRWYYVGVAATLWLSWILAIGAGASLGASVPDDLQLEFAFPLLFMALLFPNVEDRYTAFAAAVAVVVAVAGDGLPFNLGLVTAAVLGITAGSLYEWRAADESTTGAES